MDNRGHEKIGQIEQFEFTFCTHVCKQEKITPIGHQTGFLTRMGMPIRSWKEVVLDIADWALFVSRNRLTSTSRYEQAVAASTARPAGTSLSTLVEVKAG